jgi:hypothetical protein
MKKAAFIVVLMTMFAFATAPAFAAVKVFLLAGQSNMVGFGDSAGLSAPYNAVQNNVNFWSNGTNSWVPLQPGVTRTGDPLYFGPEVSFGRTIKNLNPNDSIYLVKYAMGSTNLAVNWNPNGTGANYNTFKTVVSNALKKLTNAGLSPTIAGMAWMQGEADVTDTYAPHYADNLTNFIDAVRNDFSTPDMPFVLGRISQHYWGPPADQDLVRLAQSTVPGQMDGVSWVNTDDLGLWTSGTWAGHFNTQGQIDLGVRFANAIPEPSTLVMVGAGLLTLAAVRFRWKRCRGGLSGKKEAGEGRTGMFSRLVNGSK